ncbi:astacin-like metalloendopeptidase [Centropristis striata]|uniref:astacin-like metalloendopeptidase n=1 Tax=Centropristis striata TaxID=184440 RepID=UPI0027E07C61|nr:astacin-like metalloendopeptidase [Centropristis striata]
MLPLVLAALLLLYSTKDVASGPVREDKQASGESWFSRALRYMVSNPETLEELLTRKHAVLEGDMVLPSDRNAVESIWPTRDIPYVITDEIAGRAEDILSAMAMISEHSCVSFHKRTSETNYLLFVSSRGCASYVGFIGGEQRVFVGPSCVVGNIAHELLHALGFYHEHTRTDREQHITILPHNIMKGMEGNFRKQPGETFELPYDVASIMHYGQEFFSMNGLPTIISNTEAESMGQRENLTQTDVQRVRLLYSCDAPRKELETETETESGGVEKKEEDANMHMLFHDVKTKVEGQVPAEKPEKVQTPAASPAASLQ